MKRAALALLILVLLAGTALAAWFFFLRPPALGPPVAFVRDVWGEVQSGRGTSFAALATGVTLHGGEHVRTQDASRTVLILRGAGQIIVGAETQVEILDPVYGDDQRLARLQIRLESGGLRAEAGADATVGLDLLVGDQVISLEPGGKVLVRIDTDSDQTLISFLDAAGFLTGPGGRRTRVAANHGVVVPVGVAAAAGEPAAQDLPVPPTLAAGQDESVTVYTREAAAALAKFRFVKQEARVRLLVARDPALTDIVADVSGPEGDVSAPTLAAGSYYWAVATLGESGLTGPFSPVRELRVVEGDAPVTADEKPSTTVALQSGTSGSIFFSDEVPAIGIDWPGTTRAKDPYRFELSRARNFKKPVVRNQTAESRFTARGLRAGRYYWRARTSGGAVAKGDFLVRQVTGAVPKRIEKVNRVQETYAATRIVFEREPPVLEFAWKADARAEGGYRLVVARSPSFEKPLVTRQVSENRVRLPGGKVPEGAFVWRAERLKSDGSVFYPGRTRKLSIRFDNDVPTLEITAPAQGQLITSETVEVSGLAPRGTRLWINGKRIQLDAAGRFSTRARVNIGFPRVVFETRRGKRHAFYLRTLRYAAPTTQTP